MVYLTRKAEFSASHYYHNPALTPEENQRLFGKCNNPNGHGHNYVILVTVAGAINERTGLATDIAALDRIVRETVVARFDHRDLNADPAFADKTTTGENLAILIWDLLVDKIPAGRLVNIGVVETRDNYFDYAGPAAAGVK